MPSISPVAPRIELDTDDTDFDLGYDPSTFESKLSRPGTAQSNHHSPDSPTLGAYTQHPSPTLVGASQGTALQDFGAERHSSFLEKMATPSFEEAATTAAGASRHSMSTPPTSHVVNPATIPIRTSSSNAVGEEKEKRHSAYASGSGAGYGNSQTSPRKSPKKHRSLGSVPEERRYSRRASAAHPDERDWLAQGQGQQRQSVAANGYGSGHASGSGSGSSGSRGLKEYSSTTFSQQPTLTPIPSTSYEPADNPLPTNHVPLNGDASSTTTTWTSEKQTILLAPYTYLEHHPGKDIRSQLIHAFNAWLHVPAPSLKIITSVVGMLHTASLLVDDVEDNSTLRRGVPVAHSIFGVAQTINSANYVYFEALQELLKLGNPREVVGIYTEELLNLHRGQGMDLFWRDTLTCPSEDDYLEMVGNKTGGLFRLAVRLMCAESPSHNSTTTTTSTSTSPSPSSPEHHHRRTDYTPLANTIGLLFQILDDYRNLSDTTYTANKGFCEDLTEGKFSFPVIHAIRTDPSNLTLLNILRQKTGDEEVKRYAMSYMEGTGSFAYSRRVLRGLTKKALGLVEEVERAVEGGSGGGDAVRAILERMRIDKHSRSSQSV